MGLELGAFKFGDAEFPLTTNLANELLKDADPALYAALQYLPAMLDIYVGPRLRAQAQRHGLQLPSAVVSTSHLEPMPELLAHQFQLPHLAIWRAKDVWDEHTIAFDKSTSTWEFSYLLPPLQPTDALALAPILRAVSVTLRRVIHMGTDPNYEGVGLGNNIQKARLVECTYGGWSKVDNLNDFYRALSGTISVLEREMPLPSAYSKFQGADVEQPLKAPDGTSFDGTFDHDTVEPPELTSIAPTSGSAVGGTLVTLTGAKFRVGSRPIILLGGAQCDDVSVDAANTVTFRTPPHAAYPSFVADLVYIAHDGQQASLAGAFTFNQP